MNLVVVLRRPRSVGDEIIHARAIVGQMGENTSLFPKPTPALSVVSGHIDDFAQATVDAKTHIIPISKRNTTRQLARDDSEQLRAYVQVLVRASPDKAQVLATNAGMALRKPRSFSKAPLAVKQLVEGSVRLVAKAVKGAGAYDWEYGTDGVTFERLPSTTRASTTLTGLTPGTKYYFRFRAIVKTGATDWSDPIWAIVT